jgi:hypothetical protein
VFDHRLHFAADLTNFAMLGDEMARAGFLKNFS